MKPTKKQMLTKLTKGKASSVKSWSKLHEEAGHERQQ